MTAARSPGSATGPARSTEIRDARLLIAQALVRISRGGLILEAGGEGITSWARRLRASLHLWASTSGQPQAKQRPVLPLDDPPAGSRRAAEALALGQKLALSG